MKKILFLFLIWTSLGLAQINFDDYFFDKTLRLDFFHTGDHTTEIISLDELIEEPFWGGSKNNLIDTFNYGNYKFEVRDSATNSIIYSRGFSTLFQEWQTTTESKSVVKSMSGTITFPFPKQTANVEIFRRERNGEFASKFNYSINPNNYFIRKGLDNPKEVYEVHISGKPAICLDILFLPEGYTREEMELFKEDCQRFAEYLFDYEPFSEYRDKINIRGILSPSMDAGSDIPAEDRWNNTLLNSRYYTFDSERYLMTQDYKKVRDVAANAPYDQIYILVNSDKYGGGAIYNYYSLCITNNPMGKEVFIHEFGHGFAGLADEYVDPYTYEEFYPLDVEPWEPNITTLVDFESKWKNLVDEDTPIPTPSTEEYKYKVGVFEGGGYVAKGVYRPTQNSIMRVLSSPGFNKASKNAIEQLLKFYTD
ncbi:MAG: M64 family metallopeptidase [Melioribacteraceae bacterium]|nr:M64 family metallopeptidase [Melioribacteraceae bacterium]